MKITQSLISWYQINKRELPWRSTRDPYRIWLSEVILQQTRVNQGMDYYFRFLERFPDVYSLAEASEEEVLKIWQGLGYYSRARNLHHAARSVVSEFDGKFPATYSGLLKLKGIGDYTAAAIASISFDEVVAVVDGNVARVLSRLFAMDEPVDTPAGKKILRQIAGELILAANPSTFNQAIMEFGALQCKPKNPDCASCPLRLECHAFDKQMISEYPKKQNRTIVQEVYYYYLVLTFQINNIDQILLHRREYSGIWKNLYDFPLVESSNPIEVTQVLNSEISTGLLGENFSGKMSISDEYIHQLSHRKIAARFIRIYLERKPGNIGPFLPVPIPEIGKYPVPRLIDQYLQKEGFLAQ
jgi:A/G-specific adenine glycosylase